MKSFYALLALLLGFSTFSSAQDGILDPTFGTGGFVTISLPDADSRFEALALQADGKPVVAGWYDKDLLVGRFTTSGSWDTSFDSDGYLTVSIGSIAKAYHVMVQPDGKILALGYSRSGNTESFTILRVLADGTPDATFGADGIATLAVSTSSFGEDEIYDAVLLDDGKIVIAGKSYNGQHDDFAIARFLPDGTPDPDFGTNGATVTSTEGFNFDVAQAMVIQADGKYVLGGTIGSDLGLIRFSADGVVDNSFGTDGIVRWTLPGDFNLGANDLVIQPDGKLIAGGGAFNNDELDNNFMLVRFMPDGSVDPSYGDDGVSIVQRGSNESIQSLILQDNGLVLAGGSTGGFNSAFALSRYQSNGDQDPAFGTNGWAIDNLTGGFEGINAIAQLPDGDIIAAGYGQEGSQYILALAKYSSSFMVNTQEIESLGSVRLYPNPVVETFRIDLNWQNPQQAQLTLVDAQGRLVQTIAPRQQWASGAHTVDGYLNSGLPAGMYYVVIASEEGRRLVPLQKVH